MPAQIIDGKAVAAKINGQTRELISRLKISPGLAAVVVGDDPASLLYLKIKNKAGDELGVNFHAYRLPADSSLAAVQEVINFLNNDPEISGIILQLPLPKHLTGETTNLINSIDPSKDADGFHPANQGNKLGDEDYVTPAFATALLSALLSTGEKLNGLTASLLLNNEELKNTLVSYLKEISVSVVNDSRQADIVFTALGKPFSLTADLVQEGAIVIDGGSNQLSDGALVGDADYTTLFQKVKWITPVPGGVGPITVACLLRNVVKLTSKQ